MLFRSVGRWIAPAAGPNNQQHRRIYATISTTSTDGGVYSPILLVVGTGCRRDPSANLYRHDAFKAFSSWFTFSNVLSPSDTQNLLAMSKLDCVSFKYFATGTLRDSIVVGEGAANGTDCAVIAAAVVITAGDGENITDRNPLAGIGMASPNLCGNWNCIVSSSRERSTAVRRFPILKIQDSLRNRILPIVLISSLSST